MVEKNCKDCGDLFPQFNSIQNLCNNCAFVKASQNRKVQKGIRMTRGKKTKQWLDKDRPKWFKNHPPSHEGYYECYLKLPGCLRFMTSKQTTLDHVEARSRKPGKVSRQQNLKPACYNCNQKKGSLSLAQVRKKYPVIL